MSNTLRPVKTVYCRLDSRVIVEASLVMPGFVACEHGDEVEANGTFHARERYYTRVYCSHYNDS